MMVEVDGSSRKLASFMWPARAISRRLCLVLLALALLLAFNGPHQPQTITCAADPLEPMRLEDMNELQLAENIQFFEEAEQRLTQSERMLLDQVGVSMPDGQLKNKLRVMATQHLNNLEHLSRLRQQLNKRIGEESQPL